MFLSCLSFYQSKKTKGDYEGFKLLQFIIIIVHKKAPSITEGAFFKYI